MTKMRRMVGVAGAALAVAGCAAGMGGGAGGVPAQFIGTWNGVGSQTDQPGEWTIEAIIVGGPVEQVGTISSLAAVRRRAAVPRRARRCAADAGRHHLRRM
ncbi:hypothetical protein [Longimicrobium sp.]|uniref:hypothetical protein n=1 Tax=Longimicrobium sp. TaxID=2029185 RepID=UPI003B3B4E9D